MKNKILKITGLSLLVLISFALATPFLFQGKILRHVKVRLNKDLKAHVNFSGLDISWFRHFPHMAIGLNDLTVTGTGEFSNDTLVAAKQLDLSFSLLSTLFKDSIHIYSISLEEPRIQAIILKNGHSNWNISKTETQPNENKTVFAKPLSYDLDRYAIHDGYLSFSDEAAHRSALIEHMNQEGKGDFSEEHFILKTKTTADAVSFDNGGALPWLTRAKAIMNIAFQVDNRTHTFAFQDGELAFNDLSLHTDGFFQWINDSSYNMDLRFDLPSKDFKHILSVLPALYENDFSTIKTSGSANLTGLIKGRYDNKHRPAYHVYLDIKNGFFQYADLPKPVQHINLFIHIDNPDGLADHTTINIPKGHMELANDTLDFHMLLKGTGAEPQIDAAARGKIDFAKVSQWCKLTPGTRLKGALIGDAYVEENGMPNEKHSHEPLRAGGNIDLSNFSFASAAHPGGLSLDELLVSIHPDNVMINELKGEWQTTHFTADGAFKNLFADLLKNKPVEGSIHLNADELSLNDWMGIHTDTSAMVAASGTTHPFLVPGNINLTVIADVGKVHYDNLDMQNLSGTLRISDETVQLENIKAETLEGSLVINGSYSSKNSASRPDIHFSYDAKNLDVQKAFFAFNTMQKIMPVGKFISGKLSAQMTMIGKLGANMAPDLSTLSGEGNLVLTDGEMKDFGPFDKLATSLDIAQLRDLSIKNIQTNFSYKGTKVIVSPFTINVDNLDMEIGGSHGFDQTLNYGIHLKVPKTALGNKGIEWVKNEVSQAAGKGIPVQLGNDVHMNVVMSGTINSPVVQTDMNDMIDNAAIDLKQSVNDFVQAKLDSAKRQFQTPKPSLKPINLTVHHAGNNKSKYKSRKGPQLAHEHALKTKGKRKTAKNAKKYDS